MVQTLRTFVEKSAKVKRALAHIAYGRETYARVFGSGDGAGTSAMVFTTQKGGSVFLKAALKIVGKAFNKRTYDFESLYWHTQDDEVSKAIQRDAERLFNHPNAIYGPLRDFVAVPRLAERPVVLILRDPRDVLVSAYYSRAYSHALPGGTAARAEFLKKREFARANTLDEHVIFALEEYLPKYEKYAANLLSLPNVTCLTYEDMMVNFDHWAISLMKGLHFKSDPTVLTALRRAHNIDSPRASEDEAIDRHRRQGTPQEYRRKLSPSTVERLNCALEPVLRKFDLWEI